MIRAILRFLLRLGLKRQEPVNSKDASPMEQRYLDMLEQEEGSRLKVYDDATGQPIVPGSKVIGHPTIGYGRALDTNGITAAEESLLFADDIQTVEPKLQNSLGFYNGLTDGRKYVLVSMAFELGWAGLLAFHSMLAAMRAGQWNDAAADMSDSLWAKQVPGRVQRLMQIMREGDAP